jgi:hypothetical protein
VRPTFLPPRLAATPNDVALVVGGRVRAQAALASLARDGMLSVGVPVRGWRGGWIVAATPALPRNSRHAGEVITQGLDPVSAPCVGARE